MRPRGWSSRPTTSRPTGRARCGWPSTTGSPGSKRLRPSPSSTGRPVWSARWGSSAVTAARCTRRRPRACSTWRRRDPHWARPARGGRPRASSRSTASGRTCSRGGCSPSTIRPGGRRRSFWRRPATACTASTGTWRSPFAGRSTDRFRPEPCTSRRRIPAGSSSGCSMASRRCASRAAGGSSRGGLRASATRSARLQTRATAGCGWGRRPTVSCGSPSARPQPAIEAAPCGRIPASSASVPRAACRPRASWSRRRPAGSTSPRKRASTASSLRPAASCAMTRSSS